MELKTYMGFGLDLSSVECKPDAAEMLWKRAQKFDAIKLKYTNFCELIDYEPGQDMTGLFEEFLEEYEDDTGMVEGFEGLLLDTLNAAAGSKVFKYEDYCIFVEATLPKDEEARKSMMTQEMVCGLFAAYASDLFEKPPVITWHIIHAGF